MTVITKAVNGPFPEPDKSNTELEVCPEQLTDIRHISKSVAVVKHVTLPTKYRFSLTVYKPFRNSYALWHLFKWNAWRHVIFCKLVSLFYCSLSIRLLLLFKWIAETLDCPNEHVHWLFLNTRKFIDIGPCFPLSHDPWRNFRFCYWRGCVCVFVYVCMFSLIL